MKLTKKTSRLVPIFMAILVAVSISLPSGLLAAHCDMDESLAAEMSADHCPMTASHQHEDSHDHQNNLDEECDWVLSCACDLDRQQIKAEAIPSITKTAKVFVVSVSQFVNIEPTKTPTFFTDAVLDQHTEIPPIFLLNSVFLN